MNENLIPVAIVDIVVKYIGSTNPNERAALEQRLNDVKEYVETAINVGRGKTNRMKGRE